MNLYIVFIKNNMCIDFSNFEYKCIKKLNTSSYLFLSYTEKIRSILPKTVFGNFEKS